MTVTPIPEGYHTVTPWLITSDTAKLIDFLTAAFDAKELGRFVSPDGSIGHAEARIGDSVVMMFDAKPDWPPTPGFLRFYVPDADDGSPTRPGRPPSTTYRAPSSSPAGAKAPCRGS